MALQSQTLTVLKLHPKTGARAGARGEYFGSSKPKNNTIGQGLENQQAGEPRLEGSNPSPSVLACFARVLRLSAQGTGRLYTALPTQGEVAEWLKALAC